MVVDIILYSFLLVIIDYFYLRYIGNSFGNMIKKIQGKAMKVRMLPAAVVYMSLVAAWYVFIYLDMERHNRYRNILRAGLLGFVIYSVFDFTNLAIIESYRLDLAVLDSLWGGMLYIITTYLFTVFQHILI